jgi:hypothetical protein
MASFACPSDCGNKTEVLLDVLSARPPQLASPVEELNWDIYCPYFIRTRYLLLELSNKYPFLAFLLGYKYPFVVEWDIF